MSYAPALRARNRRCLSSNSSLSRSAFNGSAFAARSASCASSLARRVFSAGVRWSGIAENLVKVGGRDIAPVVAVGGRNELVTVMIDQQCTTGGEVIGEHGKRERVPAHLAVHEVEIQADRGFGNHVVSTSQRSVENAGEVAVAIGAVDQAKAVAQVVGDFKNAATESVEADIFAALGDVGGDVQLLGGAGHFVSPWLMTPCNAKTRYMSNGKMRYGKNNSGHHHKEQGQ